jgi:hypothetical protein
MLCRSFREIVTNHFLVLDNELAVIPFCLYPFNAIVECVVINEGRVSIAGDLPTIFTETELKILYAVCAVVHKSTRPDTVQSLRARGKGKQQDQAKKGRVFHDIVPAVGLEARVRFNNEFAPRLLCEARLSTKKSKCAGAFAGRIRRKFTSSVHTGKKLKVVLSAFHSLEQFIHGFLGVHIRQINAQ